MAVPTACACWRTGVFLHSGHCCFDGPGEAYQDDAVLPPCGHWYPVLPITDTSARDDDLPGRDTRSAGEMGRKVA